MENICRKYIIRDIQKYYDKEIGVMLNCVMLKPLLKLIKKKMRLLCYLFFSTFFTIWGDKRKAILYLHKLIQIEDVKVVTWHKLGKLLGSEGHWFEAQKAFLHALYFNRRIPQYLYCLGNALEHLDDSEGALLIYEKVLAHQVNCIDALLAKGNILMNKLRFAEAVPCFYKLLELHTHNSEIYNNLGLCLMQLNNLELAEVFFEKAVNLKVKNADYAYNYGIVLLKNGYFEKAIDIMSKHIAEERAEFFSLLGYCYSSLENYQESLFYYKKALLIAPSQQENLVNLACIYARMGENEKALEILKKLLRVNPYDAHLFNNIAWIYENLKNYWEAEKNYYRGLALSPQDPNLMHNLLCCFRKQNKHCEAMEIISVLKRIPEWRNMAWSSLAHIYEKMGEKSLAVDCYNRALGLN